MEVSMDNMRLRDQTRHVGLRGPSHPFEMKLKGCCKIAQGKNVRVEPESVNSGKCVLIRVFTNSMTTTYPKSSIVIDLLRYSSYQHIFTKNSNC